jgi:hypothetical protein
MVTRFFEADFCLTVLRETQITRKVRGGVNASRIINLITSNSNIYNDLE